MIADSGYKNRGCGKTLLAVDNFEGVIVGSRQNDGPEEVRFLV